MKCRVCREPAVIDIRRHNANFCVEHFLRLCRDQVAKAIDRHEMLRPTDRVSLQLANGIGPNKAEMYGEGLVEIVLAHPRT